MLIDSGIFKRLTPPEARLRRLNEYWFHSEGTVIPMNPVSKPFLTVTAEQQPCGVQVVEWVGLVGLFRAVFAEEVGCFFVFLSLGPM